MSYRLSRIPVWVGVVLAFALLSAHLAYYAYLDVDDAYISYRYARNFARGDGLLFNPGQLPVEGYSNFLWVVMLAGTARLGIDIPLASKLLGAVLSMLTLIGVAYILQRSQASKTTVWATCGWLASSGPYAMWSMSGMETALLAASSMLALIFLVREEQSGRGILSGILLALVAFVRAEGAIFFVAAFALRGAAHLRHRSRRTLCEDVKWLLAFTIPFGVYLLWRISYYGDWIPTTVHAKAGGGYLYHTLRGSYYLIEYLIAGGMLLVILALVSALIRNERPLVRYACGASIFYVGVIVIAGGDWMPQFRFFAPILPMLLILAAVGLEAIADLWRKSDLLTAKTFVAVTTIMIGALNLVGSIQAQEITREVRNFSAITSSARIKIAEFSRMTQYGDSIALVDAGALAYDTELQVIDMIGLNDAHIARLAPQFPRGIATGNGFGKWDVDYVLAQQPTFIQLHLTQEQWLAADLSTDWVGTDALINDPRFLAEYDYVDDPDMNGLFRRITP